MASRTRCRSRPVSLRRRSPPWIMARRGRGLGWWQPAPAPSHRSSDGPLVPQLQFLRLPCHCRPGAIRTTGVMLFHKSVLPKWNKSGGVCRPNNQKIEEIITRHPKSQYNNCCNAGSYSNEVPWRIQFSSSLVHSTVSLIEKIISWRIN